MVSNLNILHDTEYGLFHKITYMRFEFSFPKHTQSINSLNYFEY